MTASPVQLALEACLPVQVKDGEVQVRCNEATFNYLMQPRRVMLLEPFCNCRSFRFPHQITRHRDLRSDYDWRTWRERGDVGEGELEPRRFGPEAGQTILEAALVLPIALLILLAIFQFGIIYFQKSALEYAARRGVDLYARPTAAADSRCPNCSASPRTVADEVLARIADARIDPTLLQEYAPANLVACSAGPLQCSAVENITSCTNVALTRTVCGRAVSFAYNWRIWVPGLPPITLHVIAGALEQ